jgi:phage tail protein X
MHRTRLHRLFLPLLSAALLLVACTGTVDTVRAAAEEKLRQTLARQFGRQLSATLDVIVQGLGAAGGFLDNPLVRVLLPPPVGLVIDVARDFHQNPRAALLETLMNRAAEQAIPGAGPILRTMLGDMGRSDMQSLFEAGRTATTDHLRATAASAVHDALLPVISENLAANGAIAIYGELLKAHEWAVLIADIPATAQAVAAEDLGEYVTARAVDGLFRTLGDKELLIREGIADLAPNEW